jgi:hypothetical protein
MHYIFLTRTILMGCDARRLLKLIVSGERGREAFAALHNLDYLLVVLHASAILL